jgi:ubiquinone/menaquinone biosynthesis C-methylase UbiE
MASTQLGAGAALDPQLLMQMWFGFAPAYVRRAAVQLNVFSQIAAGNGTAAEVARAAQATERGTRMLLDSLVALELLTKAEGRYDLAPLAAEFLVRGRPNYVAGVLEIDHELASWGGLVESIRSGKPQQSVNQQAEAERFFQVLVRSLHVVHREQGRRLAEALGAGRTPRGLRVLDLGCGSSVWGIAFAEADSRTRVTAQDFPGLLTLTREYAQRHGVEKQYDYLPGELSEVDCGENRFDLAILGHIVHAEGERSSRALFRRVHRALKPGGRVVILDMVPNDERTGPPFPLFFALNMLVLTSEGDTYTLAEYTRWLNEAGFARVETVDIGTHSPAIVAARG